MTSPRLPRLVKAFFAADLLVGVPYIVNQLIGRPFTKINRLVDLDDEANFPSWYSSVQWAVVAALMGFAVYRLHKRGAKAALPLFILAAIFLGLSLDEIAQLHEKLSIGVSGKVGSGQGALKTLWLPALGIPLLIVLGVAASRAKVAFDEAPGSLKSLVIGLVIFAFGAFGIEPITSLVLHTSGPGFVWLEETMEMLGVTFLLWSAFALAQREGILAFANVDGTAAGPRVEPRRESEQD
ncbi:MAG: hypothetical protein H7066_13130 [Cytophagaceae bacterium]|nr:hypothetical protein [Gemmatimonadaceae bacterium]